MIDTEKDNRRLVERAFLIGVQDDETPSGEAKEHLAELRELVTGMGVPVVGDVMVSLRNPRSKYLLGSGKAEEINQTAGGLDADCLVFDADLTPSQQRNWERLSGVCVLDRQEVILDIFAGRASTREAVIQVELARMIYALPRLTRAWTHLSRQKGGAKGTRGEGEQQIEVDKRLVRQKIAQLRKELKQVRRHRQTQRAGRKRHEIPQGAIVGYTNAGKSSLLNALTGADAMVADKLFATLDPTTRKIALPNNREILLTDTVGFIRKLPHTLVESFKATLEEAALSDFLVHVLDVTSASVEEHWTTTMEVLDELDAVDKPMITVFNKIDLHNDPLTKIHLRNRYPDCVFISTKTGDGLDGLREALMGVTRGDREILDLRIPPERHDVTSLAYQKGNVLAHDYDDTGSALVKLSVDKANRARFVDFIMETAG